MRLFIALMLPPEALQVITPVQRGLSAADTRRRLRLVPSPSLHLTLKFIGHLQEPEISSLAQALCALPRLQPMKLGVTGLLLLPPRRPGVVALGLGGDTAPLAHLASQLDVLCAAVGVPRDSRRLLPHVTIARARIPLRPRDAEAILAAVGTSFDEHSFTCREVALMESRPGAAGPIYTPLIQHGDRPQTEPPQLQ
jgi:2'-5' RNA ligase